MREKRATLVSFSVRCDKCGAVERSRFFKALYGWEQRIPAEKKTYVYHREGLLDDMPHMKVGQSSFIVPDADFNKVVSFFEQWSNKIIWKTFKVMMDDEIEEVFEEFEE